LKEKIYSLECKARLSPGTDQRERLHAEFLACFHSVSLATTAAANTTGSSSSGTPSSSGSTIRGVELYTIIEAASADFHLHVDSTHEAVQLLHQVYVCSFQCVLLLVGDRSGNIIRGKFCQKGE